MVWQAFRGGFTGTLQGIFDRAGGQEAIQEHEISPICNGGNDLGLYCAAAPLSKSASIANGCKHCARAEKQLPLGDVRLTYRGNELVHSSEKGPQIRGYAGSDGGAQASVAGAVWLE